MSTTTSTLSSPSLAPDALREDICEVLQRLRAFPNDTMRLKVLETEIRLASEALAHGHSQTLRAAVLLAHLIECKLHRLPQDAAGNCLYPRPAKFCAAKLREWGVGYSRSRISRLIRAGRIYLQLIEAGLPTPRAAEPLAVLASLGPKAIEVWRMLVEQAGHQAPSLQAVCHYVVAHRPPHRLKPPKDATRWERIRGLANAGLAAVQHDQNLTKIFQELLSLAHAQKKVRWPRGAVVPAKPKSPSASALPTPTPAL